MSASEMHIIEKLTYDRQTDVETIGRHFRSAENCSMLPYISSPCYEDLAQTKRVNQRLFWEILFSGTQVVARTR